MLCPACKVELRITDRQGVEVDYCPQCRGVWLDRGELDKIIDRSLNLTSGRAPADQVEPGREAPYGYRRDDDDDDYRDPRYGRRRRGWLGDLFDFD